MKMLEKTQQRGSSSTATLVILVFIAIVAAGTWAVYHYGGDANIIVNGKSLVELELWEVIGAVIIGIFGLIIGLVAGLVGLMIGLAAMVISIVLGLIGIAAGLFITAGTLLGPFLLLAAIILLLRRNKNNSAEAAAYCDPADPNCRID